MYSNSLCYILRKRTGFIACPFLFTEDSSLPHLSGYFRNCRTKKRLPEGNLFMERKTRLERRLTCACHLRSPLSRLRRQLPRGAVASPSPAVHTSKQKRDYPKVISLWSGKRDSNAGLPAHAIFVVPSVGSADSSLGERSRVRVRQPIHPNKKETTRR